ncbi:hypothetical protein F5887DRAFT_577672 [Amanita rubescens]|nr:hypothetical protein F5887DRAFT_577672 [Amanita rubescens]
MAWGMVRAIERHRKISRADGTCAIKSGCVPSWRPSEVLVTLNPPTMLRILLLCLLLSIVAILPALSAPTPGNNVDMIRKKQEDRQSKCHAQCAHLEDNVEEYHKCFSQCLMGNIKEDQRSRAASRSSKGAEEDSNVALTPGGPQTLQFMGCFRDYHSVIFRRRSVS